MLTTSPQGKPVAEKNKNVPKRDSVSYWRDAGIVCVLSCITSTEEENSLLFQKAGKLDEFPWVKMRTTHARRKFHS